MYRIHTTLKVELTFDLRLFFLFWAKETVKEGSVMVELVKTGAFPPRKSGEYNNTEEV